MGFLRRHPRLAVMVAAFLLFACVAAAYAPGLHGAFLFDDLGNLDALGTYGGVRDWHTFLYYVTASEADPFGRPVAQLSFLLDARNWPADPLPFKRTNVLLHLLNGALLLALLRKLERRLAPHDYSGTGRWIALAAAGLWLAHPLWVSTTLYVIQRQAMLAATFCLLALLAWDRTFQCWREGRSAPGWCWAIVGVGGASLLSGLSKANGFLSPLLVLVLWAIVYRPLADALPPPRARTLRRDAWLLLGPPSFLLAAYVLQGATRLDFVPSMRGWSIGQRLLSEPRALLEYLGLLIVPREGSGGVFNDNFAVSRTLWQPVTTLPAIACIVALLVLALVVRRRAPRLSAALLFFFAGHLLESGAVPLELYFEHRNYLPAMLLGWPLTAALLQPGTARRLRAAATVALLAIALLLAWQRAVVWGNPPLQAALWAQRNPDSPRAQSYAADWLQQRGRLAEAQVLLERAQRLKPNQAEITLNRVGQACTSGMLDASDLSAAEATLETTPRWHQGLTDWLDQLNADVRKGECPAVGRAGLERLLAASDRNAAVRRSAARQQMMLRWRALLQLSDGHAGEALRLFNQGLDLEPKPQTALAQAADLGRAGYPAEGLRHLDHYATVANRQPPIQIRDMPSLHAWVLQRTGFYDRELRALRDELRAAIRSAHAPEDA